MEFLVDFSPAALVRAPSFLYFDYEPALFFLPLVRSLPSLPFLFSYCPFRTQASLVVFLSRGMCLLIHAAVLSERLRIFLSLPSSARPSVNTHLLARRKSLLVH